MEAGKARSCAWFPPSSGRRRVRAGSLAVTSCARPPRSGPMWASWPIPPDCTKILPPPRTCCSRHECSVWTKREFRRYSSTSAFGANTMSESAAFRPGCSVGWPWRGCSVAPGLPLLDEPYNNLIPGYRAGARHDPAQARRGAALEGDRRQGRTCRSIVTAWRACPIDALMPWRRPRWRRRFAGDDGLMALVDDLRRARAIVEGPATERSRGGFNAVAFLGVPSCCCSDGAGPDVKRCATPRRRHWRSCSPACWPSTDRIS